MNLLGGVVGLVVMLLLAAPLIGLFAILQPELTDFQRDLGTIAELALVSFLIVYVFAVVSSYLYSLLMWLIGLIPVPVIPAILIWLLTALYLIGAGAFLLLIFPGALAAYLVASSISSVFVDAGAFGVLWLLMHFAMPFHFLFVVLAYILADAFAPPTAGGPSAGTPSSTSWRGAMVGVNAGMNMVLGAVVVGGVVEAFLGAGAIVAGLSAGLTFAVLTFVAAAMPTTSAATNGALRFIVGWTSWLMPMNWFTVTVGWITFLINMVFHVLLGLPFHPWFGLFRIVLGRIHFPTGTMFLEGGLASNLWLTAGGPLGARGAYDLGCFSNVHAVTIVTTTPIPFIGGIGLGGVAVSPRLLEHESGHNLNLEAMGTYFHLVNLVDENIFPSRGSGAFAERLAESNVAPVNRIGNPLIFFWRNT